MKRMIYFCTLFYSKINEKKVILVDYDSWEAEYSLNVKLKAATLFSHLLWGEFLV